MRKPRLTQTQKFILEVMSKHERGLAQFGAGDRRGTRVKSYGYLDGRPVIVAYGTPEWFLKARGLISSFGNEPFVYQITDAGRAALS